MCFRVFEVCQSQFPEPVLKLHERCAHIGLSAVRLLSVTLGGISPPGCQHAVRERERELPKQSVYSQIDFSGCVAVVGCVGV